MALIPEMKQGWAVDEPNGSRIEKAAWLDSAARLTRLVRISLAFIHLIDSGVPRGEGLRCALNPTDESRPFRR